jgi:hypothetical protein
MVTLHGCGGRGIDILMGSNFAHMGASNNIIMIAPTAPAPGCYDDHGYTGANFPFRYGVQPKTLMNMVDHVLRHPSASALKGLSDTPCLGAG